jgi:hypothetical protein
MQQVAAVLATQPELATAVLTAMAVVVKLAVMERNSSRDRGGAARPSQLWHVIKNRNGSTEVHRLALAIAFLVWLPLKILLRVRFVALGLLVLLCIPLMRKLAEKPYYSRLVRYALIADACALAAVIYYINTPRR